MYAAIIIMENVPDSLQVLLSSNMKLTKYNVVVIYQNKLLAFIRFWLIVIIK